MAENSPISDNKERVTYLDPVFGRLKNKKSVWTIPAPLKTVLEESIKRGNQLLKNNNQ